MGSPPLNLVLSIIVFSLLSGAAIHEYRRFDQTQCQIIYREEISNISHQYIPYQIIFDNSARNMTCVVQIDSTTYLTTSPTCFTTPDCDLKWEQDRNIHLVSGFSIASLLACIFYSMFSPPPPFIRPCRIKRRLTTAEMSS
jgi:hypothetical protein